MNKLRVGLVFDSLDVPAWIYHAVERIARSSCVELALVIINSPVADGSKLRSQVEERQDEPLVYRLFDLLDNKIFIRGIDAMATRNLAVLLTVIPTLHSSMVDLVSLKAANLDILANFSFRKLEQDFLQAEKYGVWELRFGEDFSLDQRSTGYWEVIEDRPMTQAALIVRGAGMQSSKILYRSQISTYKFSPARNRNAIRWFAAAFMVRQLELLSQLGEERFSAETAKLFGEIVSKAQTSVKLPAGLTAISVAVRLMGRIIREAALRLFRKDSWSLWFDFGDRPKFEVAKFREISPPEDRFWADPFAVREDDRYYIFVEEYVYRRRKGQISVIEMDLHGARTGSVPVLRKDFHLSYPCVFKHNGRYYMVPESASSRSIDLYECEEFPTKWKHCLTLMEGVNAVDPTLLFYEDKWWLFTGVREIAGAYPDVELFLFFADTLFTREWISHPLNPVISDVTRARPAGGIFHDNGKLYRPSQDCSKSYGSSFNVNEIVHLSVVEYDEKKIATIRPDWAPGILGTHTFSHSDGLTVVDAYSRLPRLPV